MQIKSRSIFRILIPLFSIILIFLSPIQSKAEDNPSPKIYFNEIAWRGSSISTADEWLELYNNTAKEVDLSGWEIFDESKSEMMVVIPKGKAIPSRGLFLIANNSKDYKFSKGKSVINIDPDLADTKVSLGNSEFRLSLRNQLGETVDVAGNGDEPFWGENLGEIASMQRINFSKSGEKKDVWAASMERRNLDDGVKDYGTPRASGKLLASFGLKENKIPLGKPVNLTFNYEAFDPENEFKSVSVSLLIKGAKRAKTEGKFGQKNFSFPPLPACPEARVDFYDSDGLWYSSQPFALICFQLSDQIKFSEFLPHPKNTDWNGDGVLGSSDEWIELVNFSNQKVSLGGWKIKDKGGKTFELQGLIQAEQYFVVEKQASGISLNDNGDELILIDPEGGIADKVVIPKSSSYYDHSFAKWGDTWYWTTKPTKLAQNIIVQPRAQTDPPVSEIAKNFGQPVEISGEVIEVERAGFVISTGSGNLLIKIIDGVFQAEVGKRVKIRGISYGGSSPYIEARSADIEVIENKNKTANSSNSGQEDVASQKNSKGPSLTIEKSVKIITTKKTVQINLAGSTTLKPVVLGATHKRDPGYFKFEEYLLYFVGLFVAVSIIFVYGISLRI
jgi:hypothetical protein